MSEQATVTAARQIQPEAPAIEAASPPRFIVVEGPIGVGKTTLVRRLAHSFHYEMLLEQPEKNPFLEYFYRNRRQGALSAQLFFLMQRAQQMQQLRQGGIFEPVRVADFLLARDQLFAEVTLDTHELQLYRTIYEKLSIDAPRPDRVVYLQASSEVLMERIRHRGIPAEQHIDAEYLQQISAAYSRFFLSYNEAPVLIINTEAVDLTGNAEEYRRFFDLLLETNSGKHFFNSALF